MDDSNSGGRDQMLDMFIFESNQLIEQLEEIMLETEKNDELNADNINEIFRIMHTIKGSSAMMSYNNISKLAHSVEDLFYYIRENKPNNIDISEICDVVLPASDFIKVEVSKVDEGKTSDGDEKDIEARIKEYLNKISGAAPAAQKETAAASAAKVESEKKFADESEAEIKHTEVPPDDSRYIVKLYFEEGGQMENVRAYTIVRNLMEFAHETYTYPKDLLNTLPELILENGFIIFFATNLDEKQLRPIFEEALFLKSFEMTRVESYEKELLKYNLTASDSAKINDTDTQKPKTVEEASAKLPENATKKNQGSDSSAPKGSKLSLISVNVNKLDSLMNLVGELVISESMVTKNPDLKDMQLDNFNKAARQLRKLTDELQDIVMSIRMIPIAGTFQKMQRIVRDMSRKLNKDVEFVTVGEDTEVDKNIIDHLSDPLMHLIRNAMDHGVESEEDRVKKGKAPKARITLTAHNTGGDIMISVSDDGNGINKEKIIKKAKEAGLLTKPESELTEKEIFSLLLLPGFSTKEKVTEFSGRGVGMDVVKQNIEEVGGSISIKSIEGEGTTMTIIIPLTLAIADAMELSVGSCIYTLPTVSIKESFRAKDEDIIYDNDGNEMIMIRGNIYPIIRLYDLFKIDTEVKNLNDGILIMIEGDNKTACIFADKLIGEQQVVVKPLPKYLVRYSVKESGIEGCTILGDGSISLILSAKSVINRII
ncbi:MAG TPA: chemotaxis protein CheA [Ruminiclostridium sp.]|nr:chemotaxis protein CheA [Ruminiclostridium sp.]